MTENDKPKTDILKIWVIIASALSAIVWLSGIFILFNECPTTIQGPQDMGLCLASSVILSITLLYLSWNKLGEQKKGKLLDSALLLFLSILSFVAFNLYEAYSYCP